MEAGDTPVLVHNCGTGYTDVALGLRKEGGLRNFADSRGHTHFLDSDDYESFVRDVAHEHPSATLHIVLDGFKPGSLADGSMGTDSPAHLFEAAYVAGKGNNWYATEREMYHVGKSVLWVIAPGAASSSIKAARSYLISRCRPSWEDDMKRLMEWDREFRLWHYTVSHSRLLMRSIYVERFDTRVDVLFSGVNLMHVRHEYERLAIDEVSVDEIGGLLKMDLDLPGHGAMYLLNGGAGYIHASRCSWHEDEGGHHAPSKFGPLRGAE